MSARLDKLDRKASMLERQNWEVFWGTVVECSVILKEIAPSQRRPWLARVIEEIQASQGGVCPLCGEPLLPNEWEIDHRIPFCYGGGNEPANLQIAHLACNRRKGRQVDPMDLLRYLEGRYQNR
jgi:5-methylcytosine-specific restriction endonuclease McrA